MRGRRIYARGLGQQTPELPCDNRPSSLLLTSGVASERLYHTRYLGVVGLSRDNPARQRGRSQVTAVSPLRRRGFLTSGRCASSGPGNGLPFPFSCMIHAGSGLQEGLAATATSNTDERSSSAYEVVCGRLCDPLGHLLWNCLFDNLLTTSPCSTISQPDSKMLVLELWMLLIASKANSIVSTSRVILSSSDEPFKPSILAFRTIG